MTVYNSVELPNLITLPSIDLNTVLFASNPSLSGKLPLADIKNLFGIGSIVTDYNSVSTSITGIQSNLTTLNTKTSLQTVDGTGVNFTLPTSGSFKVGPSTGLSTISANSTELDLRSVSGNPVRLREGNVTALLARASGIQLGSSGPSLTYGSGSPEGVVTATGGSVYFRTDASIGNAFYTKETTSGTTGWAQGYKSFGLGTTTAPGALGNDADQITEASVTRVTSSGVNTPISGMGAVILNLPYNTTSGFQIAANSNSSSANRYLYYRHKSTTFNTWKRLASVESGTWSPVISGSSTAGAQTYSIANTVGTFTVTDELVHCRCRIVLTAKDVATAGNLRITGLPFSISQTESFSVQVGKFNNLSSLTAGCVGVAVQIPTSGTFVNLLQNVISGGSSSSPTLTATQLTDTTDIECSFTYRKAL